jgi:hypothetical protein
VSFTLPTTAEFKAEFDRDFPFAEAGDSAAVALTKVRDADITRAIRDAGVNCNHSLFGTQAEFNAAFLRLVAHYLVSNLMASREGMRSQYNWLTQAKTVGDVTAAFSIPPRILESPTFSFMATTRYGAQYLSFISPRLIGNVASFHRESSPY